MFSAIDTDLSKTVFKSDEGYSEGEKPGKMAKNDTTVCEENVSLRHLFIYPKKNLLAKVLEAQSDTQTLRWFSLTDIANLRKSVKNIASFVSITKIRLKNVTQVTGTSSAVFLLSWHKKIVTHGCQQFRTLAVLHPKQKAYPKPQVHFTEDILPANTEEKKESKCKIQNYQEAHCNTESILSKFCSVKANCGQQKSKQKFKWLIFFFLFRLTGIAFS